MINSIVLIIAMMQSDYKCDIALQALSSKHFAVRQSGRAMLEKYSRVNPLGYQWLRQGLHSKDAEVVSTCCAIIMKNFPHMVDGPIYWSIDVHRLVRDDEPCSGCCACGWSGVEFPDSIFKYVVGYTSIYFPL